MKVRLMTKVSAATLNFSNCLQHIHGMYRKDLYNPERGKTELKPESEYFDFATTAQVAFDVNYGKIARRRINRGVYRRPHHLSDKQPLLHQRRSGF